MKNQDRIRLNAEEAYQDEIEYLIKADSYPKPANWKMSPWAVVNYIVGGTMDDGKVINTKYFGNKRLGNLFR